MSGGRLPVEMVGRRYGRLLVTKEVARVGRARRWNCVCDCGATREIDGLSLRQGHTRSCGCLRNEVAAQRMTRHGHAPRRLGPSPEWRSWQHAKARCENPSDADWPSYGGRGIGMHPAWSKSFEAFLAHIGPRPPGTSLDRIDNDKGYEPGNVRWATSAEQARNRRKPRRQDHGQG